MRRAVEGWREALSGLHVLLLWERPYCPAVLGGAVTAAFLWVQGAVGQCLAYGCAYWITIGAN